MLGIIIAAIGAALVWRNQQAATASPTTPGGTVVSVGTPQFGNVPIAASRTDVVLAREPKLGTFGDWQNGTLVPVPAGSSQDYFAVGSARSDAATSQQTGLQVINPSMDDNNKLKPVPVASGGGGAPSGTAATAASGGAPSGGFVPSGGGGLSGRGGRFTL